MKFDRWSDYNQHLTFLRRRTTRDTTNRNDTLDLDDKLKTIEDSLGFYSLRADLYDKALIEENAGRLSETNDPEMHFIVSRYLRSVLNPKLRFQIADTVFEYISIDRLIASRDERLLDHAKGDVVIAGHTPGMWCIFNDGWKVDFEDDVYVPGIWEFTFPCERRKKRFVAQYDGPWTGGPITYNWDFGDGTTAQSLQEMPNSAPWVQHTYNNSNNHTVTVHGTDPSSNSYDNSYIVHVDNDCPKTWIDKYSAWWSPVTNHCMKYEYSLWITGNDANGPWINMEAYTTHYKWINGAWRKRKADRVVAQVYGSVTQLSDCFTTNDISGADWPYNARKAHCNDAVVVGFHLPNTLFSDHRILVDGTYYTKVIPMPSPCQ